MPGLLTALEEVELARAVEAGVLAAEILASLQSRDSKVRDDLAEVVRRGQAAKTTLIERNLGLAHQAARRYLGQGLDYEDLFQEACYGLMIAVDKFNFALGNKFSTHAVWWIRYSLTLATANQGRTIRIPRYACEQIERLRRIEESLTVEVGGAPPLREVADAMGMSIDKVQELRFHRRTPVSLDTPLGADSSDRLADILIDEADADLAQQFVVSDVKRVIMETLHHQSEEVREFVFFWFWDLNGALPTSHQCRTRFGWKRGHYDRVVVQAEGLLKKLRDSLDASLNIAV